VNKNQQIAFARDFREMHEGSEILVLPNAWDVASACVLVDEGFEAVATTSGGCAFSLGFCDGENIGRGEMIEVVKRIATSIQVPVTADMEAGYGTSPNDVSLTVRETISAGAVGINLEDSTKSGPRKLLELKLSVERIQAARQAAGAAGIRIVINARTDGYMLGSDEDMFDETVLRSNAYLEAGADCAFVIGVRNREVIGRLVKEINGPLNVLAGPGSPAISELQELGVSRVTVGGNIAKAAYSLVKKAANELKGIGTYEFASGVYTQPEMHRIIKGEKS
jgi:2-methylisocitrate lyase-like PEP mutase family enzyme